MKSHFLYGHTYRAKVVAEPLLKTVLTAEMLASELKKYQLFGQVTDTTYGYMVEAEFRGTTGTYMLPDGVETVEMIR